MQAEYLNGVLITESKVDPVDSSTFNKVMRLQHSRMGIITELGELIDIYKKATYYGKEIKTPHVIEELGDLFWYVGLGFNVLGIIAANPEMKPIANDSVLSTLEVAMHTVTNREMEYEDRLHFVYRAAITVVRMQGLNYQEILDKNFIKLRARYGESFDADHAVNRNTAAEQAAVQEEG